MTWKTDQLIDMRAKHDELEEKHRHVKRKQHDWTALLRTSILLVCADVPLLAHMFTRAFDVHWFVTGYLWTSLAFKVVAFIQYTRLQSHLEQVSVQLWLCERAIEDLKALRDLQVERPSEIKQPIARDWRQDSTSYLIAPPTKIPELLRNQRVTVLTAPNPGTGRNRLWSAGDKTGREVLADLRTGVRTVAVQSKGAHRCTHIAMSIELIEHLSAMQLVPWGEHRVSVLAEFMRSQNEMNRVIQIVPLVGAGLGDSNRTGERVVFYSTEKMDEIGFIAKPLSAVYMDFGDVAARTSADEARLAATGTDTQPMYRHHCYCDDCEDH